MTAAGVPDPIGGRVVVAGDWHANTTWALQVIEQTADAGIDTIVHLGDLGVLWPGDSRVAFTRELERALTERGVHLVFADGNHDSHTRLRQLPLDQAGFAVASEHVRWAPRGHRWSWPAADGRIVRFGAVGGAFSIDWRHRTPGASWWPIVEEVQPGDLDALGTDPLDVLITHDAPTGAVPPAVFTVPIGDEVQSQVSRDLLRRAVDTVRPALVFCGHWHQRHTFAMAGPRTLTTVEVLNRDGARGNWVMLDLVDLTRTESDARPLPSSTWR